VYVPGHAKQPDQSFQPRGLPAPSTQNGILHQPGTSQPFPSFVIEIAFCHEDRELLISDAVQKYFNQNTSVKLWLGIKIYKTRRTWWGGWGVRAATGYGLRMCEQTEDAMMVSTDMSVDPPPDGPLAGEFRLPSSLLYDPLPIPAGDPLQLVLPFEELRQEIHYAFTLVT
jgi:hypothetical protein